MAKRLYPSDVAGRRVLWLLTFTWGGHVIRIADEEVDVEGADGRVYHYTEGLGEISVTESVAIGGTATGMLSVPMEVLLPANVDVPLLVARGHSLGGVRAELARWAEGTLFESRRSACTGYITDPETGEADEPIVFSIEERIAESAALTGSARARVVGANWEHITTIPTEYVGADLPIVIGRPGHVSTDVASSGWITGGWAVPVDYRRTAHDSTADGGSVTGNLTEIRHVIAAHHTAAGASGTGTVYVNSDDYTAGYRIRCANSFDDRGNPVTILCWFAAAAPAGAPEDDYVEPDYAYSFSSGDIHGLGANALHVSFNASTGPVRLYVGWRDPDNAGAGGLTVAGKLVREAGEVAAYFFGLAGAPVAYGALSAVAPMLARIKIDGVIVERTSVWLFLRDELLPLLPASLASSAEGLYLLPWRWDATANDAVAHLNADTNVDIERTSALRTDAGQCVNRVIVRYNYSFREKQYLSAVTIGPESDRADAEDPARFIASPYCDVGRGLAGEVREREISTAFCYDDSSAFAIGTWIAGAFALPARDVGYSVPEAEFLHVTRGSVVTITDARMRFNRKPCVVREIETNGSPYLRLTLRLIDRPGEGYVDPNA